MNKPEDEYVRHFLQSRDSAARQKIKLAGFRARYPEGIIFSVEGIDDKQVYFHWIRQSIPQLECEMHICNTKDDALKLLDAIRRDKTGLAKDVYFLLDRDFDGLKGREPGPEVLLTEAYSIENYLVSTDVLDGILKVELHCHGEPQCRTNVTGVFEGLYAKFLGVTRDLNFRIFISRRASIKQIAPLPNRIADVASISLLDVAATESSVASAAQLEREPRADELHQHQTDFDTLTPGMHYRGKFALMFFTRWLNLLVGDRRSENPQLFPNMGNGHTPTNNFTLDMMAGRSKAPPELHRFLQGIAAG